MLQKKYDYLVVGAGLFGATFAQRAVEKGKKVLVVDKRSHIAGNVYTEQLAGVRVHKYGAHIFHTNDVRVWKYLNQFADFNRFTNSPLANYKGEFYSLPFNMYTFNKMWGVTTPAQAQEIISRQRCEALARLSGQSPEAAALDPSSVSGYTPRNLEEQAISLVGTDIYQKLVKGYTEKQWGRSCQDLPAFIIKRLPVRFNYDNNYYSSRFQGIPFGGYTHMVEQMLLGAEVRLNTDYLEHRAELDPLADMIIYTGPIDAFYNYCEGYLQYRSLHFETEVLNMSNYQGNAVINYTDAETPWTRIIEHKWFDFGRDDYGETIPKTVITREYSREWAPGSEPYYPVNDEQNSSLYAKYKAKTQQETKVIFGGRLAEYKYYDMDQVISAALRLSDREL